MRTRPLLAVLYTVLMWSLLGSVVAQSHQAVKPLADQYRIVYFTLSTTTNSTSAVQQPPVTIRQMADNIASEVITRWEDVIAFDRETPLDALLIDGRALFLVDKDWATAAYQRGVVIGGFNILGSEMATLVGNPCIETSDFAEATPNYILVQMQITWTDSNAADRIEPRPFARCAFSQPIPALEGGTISGSNRSADMFERAARFEQFRGVLETYLELPHS